MAMAMEGGSSWFGMVWEDCEVGEPINRRDAPVTMDGHGGVAAVNVGPKDSKEAGSGAGRSRKGRRRAAVDARASAKSDASQAERWLLSEKGEKEAGRRGSS